MAQAATRDDVLAYLAWLDDTHPREVFDATTSRLIDEMLSEPLTLSPMDIVSLTELMDSDLGIIGGEDVPYV